MWSLKTPMQDHNNHRPTVPHPKFWGPDEFQDTEYYLTPLVETVATLCSQASY